MKPSDFKVGDRVRIAEYRPNHLYSGTTGTVYNRTEDCLYLKDHHGQIYGFMFADSQVELITSAIDWQAAMISNTNALLSQQSLQPQQIQQKEDTVNPYAVIYHPLSAMQNATIVGYHTTEAQAKEAVETMVAGYRANLQAKAYFAITIVNTKTGKLVGSVVDAPPAVDWAS